MEKEIRVRKKRFAAFWAAVLMVCGMVLPMAASASDYTITVSQTNEISGLQSGDILYENDTILYTSEITGTFSVAYFDHNNEVIGPATAVSYNQKHTVNSYSSLPDDAAFQGWRVNAVSVSSGILEAVTLYARISYPITYSGVENATHTNGDRYTYGSTVTLTDASRPGYTFDGWFTDPAYETEITGITESTEGALTLYAKFTANPTHAIAYELNGGTNGNNPASYVEGLGTTLEAASKPGHSFAGWYETGDFSGTPLTAIDANQKDDITLYAKFTVNPYTITFDTAGGSEIAPIQQDYASVITPPGDPTRENYYFAGWDKEIPTTMPAEDVTITAKWTPRVIDAGTAWYLEAGKEYKLGSATTVDGDRSTYAAGAVFYVAESGNYTFN